jgi:hypothetical protein
MDDLEICKRIAEIEGAKETFHSISKPTSITAVFENRTSFGYNPLTDDALCFQLMVKYDMPPMKSGEPSLYECIFDMDRAISGAGIICDESPNKAICLAIIEAHKEH